MSDLFEYKCPGCGGTLKFDARYQEMKCPYCGVTINVEALAAMDEELGVKDDSFAWEQVAETTWSEGETDGMKVYVCNSCGGEIVCDESTAATKCPYCDNPVVMKGNFEGDLKPDLVIPFKISKEQAKAAYFKHLEGKEFLPKVFRDENHIDEMKAIYVPFWLFDCDADVSASYRGTNTTIWQDSKNEYIKTDYYHIMREGSLGFDKIPVDGSLAIPDDLTQSVEPFDISEAVDFKTAYLAGYLADKYTVGVKESIEIANARVKDSCIVEFGNTVTGYGTVTPEYANVSISNGACKYAMYPLWIMNTTYENQKFIFAINGQTGKAVGDLPLDKGACRRYYIKSFLSSAAASAIALSFIAWLFL